MKCDKHDAATGLGGTHQALHHLKRKLQLVVHKINERLLFIEKPGVYYGQCSELCGARHAFMPIVIEAVSRPVFNSWLKANGGTVASAKDAKPGTAAPAVAPAAAPAADASAKPSA